MFCTDIIKKYSEVIKNQKWNGIRGLPGSGKYWTMEYCILHSLLWRTNVITTYKWGGDLSSQVVIILFIYSFCQVKNNDSTSKNRVGNHKVTQKPKVNEPYHTWKLYSMIILRNFHLN